jgi:putative SOS response-associated peptidase YedK
MCFHISNTKKVTEVEDRFDVRFEMPEIYNPYYHFNGFEKKYLYVILQDDPYYIEPAYWGLIPNEVDISKRSEFLNRTNTLNATSERLFTSSLFSQFIHNQRCLIVADGLYEPHKVGGVKGSFPHYFKYVDGGLFAFAGIYSELDDGLFTASIITTEANPLFKEIHNSPNKLGSYRMPLILDEKDEFEWLNPNLNEAQIKEILFTFTSKEFEAYPVHKDVFNSRVKSNRPDIIERVYYDELNTLF